MDLRVKQVLDQINNNVDVRSAIAESTGVNVAHFADKIQMDSTVNSLAKEGKQKELEVYIRRNFNAFKLPRRLSAVHIRRLAQELIRRERLRAGE